jgi:hypothetical protein
MIVDLLQVLYKKHALPHFNAAQDNDGIEDITTEITTVV